jgi:hypothetical protein
MIKSKALTSFSELSDGNLESKAGFILSSLTENFNFTSPSPGLEVLAEARDAYSLSLTGARKGTRSEISIKKQKRAELIAVLNRLATYVNFIANGDRSILQTSGFDVNSENEPFPSLTRPTKVVISNGENPGELNVSVEKVPGALAYIYQYTLDPSLAEDSWQSKNSTYCKTTIKGLQQMKRYWIRVAVLGVKEQMMYSDVHLKPVV